MQPCTFEDGTHFVDEGVARELQAGDVDRNLNRPR
jgi:hypothetical protein